MPHLPERGIVGRSAFAVREAGVLLHLLRDYQFVMGYQGGPWRRPPSLHALETGRGKGGGSARINKLNKLKIFTLHFLFIWPTQSNAKIVSKKI